MIDWVLNEADSVSSFNIFDKLKFIFRYWIQTIMYCIVSLLKHGLQETAISKTAITNINNGVFLTLPISFIQLLSLWLIFHAYYSFCSLNKTSFIDNQFYHNSGNWKNAICFHQHLVTGSSKPLSIWCT